MRAQGDVRDQVIGFLLSLIENRDNSGIDHIERTEHYMGILYDQAVLGGPFKAALSRRERSVFVQASAFHDIGKIYIDEQLLKKPGKLTAEELELIKKHTTAGEQVLRMISEKCGGGEVLECARIMALFHHEKWDGTGYPRGVRGGFFPVEGQFMALSDVYEALTSERPYKKAMSPRDAASIIIKGSGLHFNPDLVALFQSVEDRFSIGLS